MIQTKIKNSQKDDQQKDKENNKDTDSTEKNKSDESQGEKVEKSESNRDNKCRKSKKRGRSLDEICRDHKQETEAWLPAPYNYSSYPQASQSKRNATSGLFQNNQSSQNNQRVQEPYRGQNYPPKRNEGALWNCLVEGYHQGRAQDAQREEELSRQREYEHQQILLQEYIQKRRMEVALLDYYDYTYEPSEQNFTELAKNQLIFKSAEDSYAAMGSFSYDYWISSKPAELKKIMKDSDLQVRQFEAYINYERNQWEEKSLNKVRDKEKLRLAQEKANQIKIEQAAIDKKKSDIELLSTYGYLFQESPEQCQKLKEIQQQLQDTIVISQQSLSMYDYWFNNHTVELAKKIKDLTQSEKILQREMKQFHHDWQQQSLDAMYNLPAYQALQVQLKKEKYALQQALFEEQVLLKNASLPDGIHVENYPCDLKNLTEYVNNYNPQSAKEVIKDSDHCYKMPHRIKENIRKKFIDKNNDYSKKMSGDEIKMIDFMLNSMVYAQDNMTVQLAQTGLQAWLQAEQSQTDEKYDYYVNQTTRCYNQMRNNIPKQSICKHAKLISREGVDDLLEQYNTQIQVLRQAKKLDLQSDVSSYHNQFEQRLENRQKALIQTKEQLNSNNLTNYEYKMSSQARGFMMVNNLNYAAFDAMKSTAFQDCLTKENLEIIESSVQISKQCGVQPEIKEIAKHTCSLAVAAQQLNQLSHIEQATAITDVNHVFNVYEQVLYEHQQEIEMWNSLGRGLYKGTSQAFKKWNDFLIRLGHEPRATMGKMIEDCKAVGICLGYVAAELYEHTPFAYQFDECLDFVDNVADLFNNGSMTPRDRRAAIRAQRNVQAIENGATHALNASLNIITQMAEKSFEDNVADITEFGVDGLITSRALESLAHLAKFTGGVLVEAGREMLEVTPKRLLDSSVKCMKTTTGDLIVIAEKTGEDLHIVTRQQIAINRSAKIAKGEKVTHEVQQLTKASSTRMAKLKAQFEKYYRTDILLPGLEKIEGVKQIENYRAITKNFTTIEQLTEADIMYLNMCNGLHAHSVEINNLVEKAMLYVVDLEGNMVHINKFDIYHSFLGEMKPGAMGPAKLGGHLFFPESKAFTHAVEKIVPLENGYFDIFVKHIADDTGKFRPKTQFPLGSTPLENAQIMIDLITEIKNASIKVFPGKNGQKTFNLIQQCGQKFTVHVENGVAIFYPISPKAPTKII